MVGPVDARKPGEGRRALDREVGRLHQVPRKEGYRAVMLTDTALYRYPQYHSAEDRPEKINAGEFARAADGIIKAVQRLVSALPG